MISCLHTCMHACCIISITPPSESQRSSCIDIKVCDRGLIDWWLGSIWPPAFSDVISHGPHQQSIHSIHTLILSSNLYLAWVVSILGWLLPSYYFFTNIKGVGAVSVVWPLTCDSLTSRKALTHGEDQTPMAHKQVQMKNSLPLA